MTFMINIMHSENFWHDAIKPFESMPFCVFFRQWHTIRKFDDSMVLVYRPVSGWHRIHDSGYR
ncbi:hypothetical protein Ef18B233LT_13530 [Escherichia fergusonii]|nr:hypothetical protein [Escherichia fergusonii]KWW05623.1 hypothetical protein VP22_0217930 [Escherichia fergusonii]KWW06376.1 hypothetical protein VL22_0206050 [Escherichia fergusonii]KWW07510.1 hypothetical protein VK87_0204595 [Escherichia fergusonii]QCZ32905.1 hypothetical protein D8Z79_014290 [Escherichia fergusonii]